MADFLVDSDVLIDISKGNSLAADYIDGLPGEIAISRISTLELLFGARNKREQRIIERFLSRYRTEELSVAIGQRAYVYLKQYALSHGLTAIDALIAATASVNGLILVSRNEKHFKPVQALDFLKAVY